MGASPGGVRGEPKNVQNDHIFEMMPARVKVKNPKYRKFSGKIVLKGHNIGRWTGP
jgi:hypothetical protein